MAAEQIPGSIQSIALVDLSYYDDGPPADYSGPMRPDGQEET